MATTSKQNYKNIKKAREIELDVLEFYGEETEKVLNSICCRRKTKTLSNFDYTKPKKHCENQKPRHFRNHTTPESAENFDGEFQDENQTSRRHHKKRLSKCRTRETKTIVCHNISFKNLR